MSAVSYQLPGLLGQALSKLPAYPGSVLFAKGLNRILVKHLPFDTLRMLDGRPMRIQLRDADIAFDFIWRKGAFWPVRHCGEIALTISANAYDFILMAQRKEDPDTLFFNRRLLMEGDTELGLLVKNSLDAIDVPVFSAPRFVFDILLKRRHGPRRPADDAGDRTR